MATQLWSIILVVVSSLLAAASPILLKKASERKFYPIKMTLTNYFLFTAGFLYIVSLLIFVIALKGGDLLVLYPLSSLGYVWACISSVRFLGEKMDLFKWAGICLIILGVSLVGIGSLVV